MFTVATDNEVFEAKVAAQLRSRLQVLTADGRPASPRVSYTEERKIRRRLIDKNRRAAAATQRDMCRKELP